MTQIEDIMRRYTKDGLLVEAVHEYESYYVPSFVGMKYIDPPCIGFPLVIEKGTGRFLDIFPEGRSKTVVNPEREKYRKRLDDLSMELTGRHYKFPSEREDE